MTLKDLPLSKQEKKKLYSLTPQEEKLLKEKYGTVAGELDTRKPNSPNAHFDITFQDRQRLRKVVKTIHFKNYPKEFITDKEADKLIEALGPKVAEDMIKKYIDQIK
jgi:hypothetical protein